MKLRLHRLYCLFNLARGHDGLRRRAREFSSFGVQALLFFASGLGSAFASSYEVWLVTRFLWGAASLGLRAVKTVMSLELVGSKWRAIICVGLIEGGWTLGNLNHLALQGFITLSPSP